MEYIEPIDAVPILTCGLVRSKWVAKVRAASRSLLQTRCIGFTAREWSREALLLRQSRLIDLETVDIFQSPMKDSPKEK